MNTLQPLRVLSSDGCPIALWSGGPPGGHPVVFLHGFALDHTIWQPVLKRSQLLARCRVMLPDLRGHGASGRASESIGYGDGRRWADDLAAVLDLVDAQRATVVAWSFGGRMLLDYVRHHGTERLHALNLVAAASVADPRTLGSDHTCLERLCAAQPDIESAAARQFIAAVTGAANESAEIQAQLDVLSRTSPAERAALRCRPLDYDALLARLQLPVLVTHGACDTILLSSHALHLGGLVGHARVSIYEGAGHAPFRDAPARFASELIELASTAREEMARP